MSEAQAILLSEFETIQARRELAEGAMGYSADGQDRLFAIDGCTHKVSGKRSDLTARPAN
ncbi:MAG: hypothetical protein J0H54_05815 [Rhizobiales bacterium]|nr:hypothetical protein [Hyphomicrobiales bacterium]